MTASLWVYILDAATALIVSAIVVFLFELRASFHSFRWRLPLCLLVLGLLLRFGLSVVDMLGLVRFQWWSIKVVSVLTTAAFGLTIWAFLFGKIRPRQ